MRREARHSGREGTEPMEYRAVWLWLWVARVATADENVLCSAHALVTNQSVTEDDSTFHRIPDISNYPIDFRAFSRPDGACAVTLSELSDASRCSASPSSVKINGTTAFFYSILGLMPDDDADWYLNLMPRSWLNWMFDIDVLERTAWIASPAHGDRHFFKDLDSRATIRMNSPWGNQTQLRAGIWFRIQGSITSFELDFRAYHVIIRTGVRSLELEQLSRKSFLGGLVFKTLAFVPLDPGASTETFDLRVIAVGCRIEVFLDGVSKLRYADCAETAEKPWWGLAGIDATSGCGEAVTFTSWSITNATSELELTSAPSGAPTGSPTGSPTGAPTRAISALEPTSAFSARAR